MDWDAWREHGDGFGEWAADRLHEQYAWGAQGLKIWKKFGLSVRDHRGDLVSVDDPRLDPLWKATGELKIPVLIHVADPLAFFEPLDATNERWEELNAHPDWHFPGPPYPPCTSILESLARLIERQPETIFIGAGSTVFTTELIGDILLTPALEHGVFALVDINAERLELAHLMAEFLIERTGKAWTSDGGSSYRSRLFIRKIRSMFDEMVVVEKDYLPEFLYA